MSRSEDRRWTKAAVRSMQLGNQCAVRYNHEYFGSEHLLAGLLSEESGSAAAVLRGVGADPTQIKDQLFKTMVPNPDIVTCSKVPRTDCLARALETAALEAEGMCEREIDTRHMLIGLTGSGGLAAEVLRQHGVQTDKLRGGGAWVRVANDSSSAHAPGGNGA